MVVLQAVVSAIQTRPPSRWLTHENIFAKELGLGEGDSYSAVDELNEFIVALRIEDWEYDHMALLLQIQSHLMPRSSCPTLWRIVYVATLSNTQATNRRRRIALNSQIHPHYHSSSLPSTMVPYLQGERPSKSWRPTEYCKVLRGYLQDFCSGLSLIRILVSVVVS